MPRISLSATLLLVVLALSAAAARADVAPQYFDLPVGHPAAGGIAADADGDVWLGSGSRSDAPELARLRVATGAVELYPTPKLPDVGCCANLVRSLTFEPSRRKIWFSQADGIVGTANPAATVPGTSTGFEAVLLRTQLNNVARSAFSPDVADLAADPRGSGTVWFTERSTTNVDPFPGARIGSMSNAAGVPFEYANIAVQGTSRSIDSLRYDAQPAGIAVGPDGKPWFAESDPGNPGWRLATPRSATVYDEISLPCGVGAPCSGSYTGTGVTDVAVGADNALWFTNELRREIGRLSPDRSSFKAYRLADIDPALAAGRPFAVTTASDGTIWAAIYGGYSSAAANAIVKITPQTREDADAGFNVWRLGFERQPLAVTDDRRGNIWFSVSAISSTTASSFGRLAGVVGGGTPDPGNRDPGGGVTPPGGTPATPVPPPRTVRATATPPGRPTVSGDTATIDQICVGPPEDKCSLVYIISAHEYVTGFPNTRTDDRDRGTRALASASAAAKKKPTKRAARRRTRALILGQKFVTLKGGQRAKVRVTLNAAGRRLLKRSGKLTLYLTATQRGADGVGKRIKAVKVTFRAKRAGRRAPAKKRR
ncbi:hypothetical protein Q5424_01960 [Conexibacter sp. JD483]|uniref:Vgb family protein n=1 Tax=unclassified Conexibacter TaxID=2627773 RepID=UPI00271F3DBA|nr:MULTISPECIES: hypothetical protein [unclassified Conexibacter]MDO8185653.1 hypothetical protein [Conexibacter sp. CPCC 205706]MDO8198826.1 hypothetical protein [Conexibacter sp. CPCC 205762]MDR9367824.1 hypothetical protein [Conexibacter sp. JD483]